MNLAVVAFYMRGYGNVNELSISCLFTLSRSLGGMIVDGGQSVTAWGINVGSKLAQGVSKLYSNIFSTKPSSMSSCHPSSLPPILMSGTGMEILWAWLNSFGCLIYFSEINYVVYEEKLILR